MKKTAIDLSSLTEAQKKMCVQLLAKGNFQFDPQSNGYQATLKIPNNQAKEFSTNVAKDKNKQNKPIDKPLTAKPVPKSLYKNGKKKLSRVTKLMNLERLETFHSEIQIYIYPKRISLGGLLQVIQNTYQNCWASHKNSCTPHEISLHEKFHSLVCPKDFPKCKNDQNLVNILDSINHFQYKQLGVKLFYMFLSEQLDHDQFLYFLVLRSLLIEMMGQTPILIQPSRSRIAETSRVTNSSHIDGFIKLKWNPNQAQIQEFICKDFLKISSLNQQNTNDFFEKLTECMYYDQEKKGNYIQFYELLHFMVTNFAKQSHSSQIQRLNLSYSREDSTLNDLLFMSATHPQPSSPLQLQYKSEFKKEDIQEKQLGLSNRNPENFDLKFICLVIEKVQQIAVKMKISQYGLNKIKEKVHECVQSIQKCYKMQWIECMQLTGTTSELRYIEQLQQQYSMLKQQLQGNGVLMNSMIKRFLNGPGVMSLICSQFDF